MCRPDLRIGDIWICSFVGFETSITKIYWSRFSRLVLFIFESIDCFRLCVLICSESRNTIDFVFFSSPVGFCSTRKMMKMQIGFLAVLMALSVASLFEFGLASPNTVPAFLWSPHLQLCISLFTLLVIIIQICLLSDYGSWKLWTLSDLCPSLLELCLRFGGLIWFMWLSKLRSANGELNEAVNYQVMSAKDLVDSVFTQGGWSNFLVCFFFCSHFFKELTIFDSPSHWMYSCFRFRCLLFV